jgi:hypothetical protein
MGGSANALAYFFAQAVGEQNRLTETWAKPITTFAASWSPLIIPWWPSVAPHVPDDQPTPSSGFQGTFCMLSSRFFSLSLKKKKKLRKRRGSIGQRP